MVMFQTISDDLRQSCVVAGNEIRKFVSAKRFWLYMALVALIVGLMTAIPYVIGDGISGPSGEIFAEYINYVSLLAVIGVTMFASNTIVSEFEERTALVIFTRPIRRSSIFVGKLIACYGLVASVMVVYYLISVLIAFVCGGDLVRSFLPSLAMTLLFTFAATGIGMLISSVFRKGGSAAVMTFMVIILLIPVITSVMAASGYDIWFMLDNAMSSITTSIPEYVESRNSMAEAMGMPMLGVDPADCLRSGTVMFAWGLFPLLMSYFLFSKREF